MRMVIADPTVPLDVAGEVYIAGEDHFFKPGSLSDKTAAPLSFLGQGFTALMRSSCAQIIEIIGRLKCI